MALESTFRDLVTSFGRLQEDLGVVLTTIQEDRPLYREVALPEILGDLVLHIMGLLDEATQAGVEALAAVDDSAQPAADLNRARKALVICQERYSRMAYSYSADLMSYERISELLRVGRDRDRAWRAWASSVKSGLEACRQGVHEAGNNISKCLFEVAERVGMSQFSVQNNTVGQSINVPKGAGRVTDLEVARST